jgi:catechol 2,3-dioxygenase-like lactoylglutathione lyase family enzyme
MRKRITETLLVLSMITIGSLQASDVGKDDDNSPAFWHLGLVVSDLDTMDRFYGAVIGLRRDTDLLVEDAEASSGTEGAIVVPRLDALMAVAGTRIEIRHYSDLEHKMFLELLHYPDHPAGAVERGTNHPLGLGHLGISVSAIEPVLERIQQTGLGELMTGPQLLAGFGHLRYAFLKDPEGNLVELRETGSDH